MGGQIEFGIKMKFLMLSTGQTWDQLSGASPHSAYTGT